MKFFHHMTLSFVLLLSPLVAISGGFTVKNGAGLAEFNVEYAHLQLPQVLRFCVEQSLCELSSAETSAIKKVLLLPSTALQFLDDKAFAQLKLSTSSDGIFKLDQQNLISVRQGALYPHSEPLSVSAALTSLIEVQAQKVEFSADAEALARKIVTGSQMISETLSLKSFGFSEAGFSFVQLHQKPLLVFRDTEASANITPMLEQSLLCPKGPATLETLSSMKWSPYLPQVSGEKVTLHILSKVEYLCRDNGVPVGYKADLDIQIVLTVLNGPADLIVNGKNGTRFRLGGVGFETSFIGKR